MSSVHLMYWLTTNRISGDDFCMWISCHRCSFSILAIAGDDLLLPGLTAWVEGDFPFPGAGHGGYRDKEQEGNQECPNRLSIKGRFHGTTSVRTVPSSSRTRVLRPIILAILFASSEAISKEVAVVWRCHSKKGFSSWTRNCPLAMSLYVPST